MLHKPSVNDRMVLAAIVDRIIFGQDATFQAADAEELLRILPPPSLRRHLRLPFEFSGKAKMTSSRSSGYAAGIGNVSVPGGERSYEFDSRAGRMVRAGQWRIQHEAGFFDALRGKVKLNVEQYGTEGGLDGKGATLEYEGQRPVRLLQHVPRSVQFGVLTITVVTSVPWKTPA